MSSLMLLGFKRSQYLQQELAMDGGVVGVALDFFFSSRRRHTRLQGDWSSDVCSSDLGSGRKRLCRRANDHARFPLPRALELAQLSHTAPNINDELPIVKDRESTTVVKDRKSTRLNSSHLVISYAVFCLKKKR